MSMNHCLIPCVCIPDQINTSYSLLFCRVHAVQKRFICYSPPTKKDLNATAVRKTTAVGSAVGSPNSLVDCGDGLTILFQHLVICATFEIIQSLDSDRIFHCDFENSSFPIQMMHDVQGMYSNYPQKMVIFSRDHVR